VTPPVSPQFWKLVLSFPKNVGGGEVGGVGKVENVFRTLKKKGQKKFSQHNPVKFRVRNFFPYKFLLKHA
jgi:hypothetical protein